MVVDGGGRPFGGILAAQVLPGEEGILERGRRLPGEVSVEALVDSVARWGRTEREKVIVLAGVVPRVYGD